MNESCLICLSHVSYERGKRESLTTCQHKTQLANTTHNLPKAQEPLSLSHHTPSHLDQRHEKPSQRHTRHQRRACCVLVSKGTRDALVATCYLRVSHIVTCYLLLSSVYHLTCYLLLALKCLPSVGSSKSRTKWLCCVIHDVSYTIALLRHPRQNNAGILPNGGGWGDL